MNNGSDTHGSADRDNGSPLPATGYGTFGLRDRDETAAAVRAAIAAGYRLIDTAADYANEGGVGDGVRTADVARSDLLVSTKVWPGDLGYDATLRAFDRSIARLGLDYVDLYLIHWPCSDALNAASWKAIERLHDERRVRMPGVSNFTVAQLEALVSGASVTPVVNQIEFHPGFHDAAVKEYCDRHGIVVEAWSPLMQGAAFSDETLARIGRKHGKSSGQVALRWCVEMGTVPLPKTRTPQRMTENLAIFDFELDSDDMESIGELHAGVRLGPDPESYRFCGESSR